MLNDRLRPHGGFKCPKIVKLFDSFSLVGVRRAVNKARDAEKSSISYDPNDLQRIANVVERVTVYKYQVGSCARGNTPQLSPEPGRGL